jgi:hypothetical protein
LVDFAVKDQIEDLKISSQQFEKLAAILQIFFEQKNILQLIAKK